MKNLKKKIVCSENRGVLLLIENARGHNISLELKNKLTNVEVFYLPANTTSVLQPLSQGIIRTFKLYYRKLFTFSYSREVRLIESSLYCYFKFYL